MELYLKVGDVPAKRGWYWWYVPERYIAHGPFPCEEDALDNVQMKDWKNIPPGDPGGFFKLAGSS